MKTNRLLNIVMFIVIALPFMVSCSKDDGDGGNAGGGVTVTLSSEDYTEDGYFDGLMYYKITSNSENTIEMVKAESSAEVVEIPQFVNINGKKYSVTSIGK